MSKLTSSQKGCLAHILAGGGRLTRDRLEELGHHDTVITALYRKGLIERKTEVWSDGYMRGQLIEGEWFVLTDAGMKTFKIVPA